VRLTFVLAGQNPTATWRPTARRLHREVRRWRLSSSAPVLPQSGYETVGAGNGLPQPQPNRRNGLPRRFIPKQPTCRYTDRVPMSFNFNRFNFLVPDSQHTWLCKSLQSDLASTLPQRLQSIFSDCLDSFTSDSRVPAPVDRHGLDGPAREAGTKKYPLPRKLSGQRGEKAPARGREGPTDRTGSVKNCRSCSVRT